MQAYLREIMSLLPDHFSTASHMNFLAPRAYKSDVNTLLQFTKYAIEISLKKPCTLNECCWRNGAHRLAQCRIQFVKKHSICSAIKQGMPVLTYI